METNERDDVGNAAHMPEFATVSRARPPRRVFSVIGGVAAVLMAVLLVRALVVNPGGPLFAARTAPPGLLPGEQLPQLNGSTEVELNAIKMVSSSDGWLSGVTYSLGPDGGGCAGCGSFILRYDGTKWTHANTPTDLTFTAVSMVSRDDGWAVSRNTIYHYDGSEWSAVYTYVVPNDTIYLNALAMVSPTEGWVAGSDGSPSSETGFLLHYSGGHWRRIALPDAGDATNVSAISMLSPSEGWALETIYSGKLGNGTRLLHYTNGAWQSVGDMIPASLYGIAAVSAQLVWMVGAVTGTMGGIFEYASGHIEQVPSPTPNILHAITMLSPSDGWAVGDGAATLHWDGSRWTKMGLVIHGVALVSVSFATPDDGWAAGSGVSSDAQGAALLHYTHGTWSIYPLKIGG